MRIGGTTRASVVCVPHPMILKYVGWSNSRLADCAQRYMRCPPHELARIAFLLMHSKQKITVKFQIYDSWSERLDAKCYKLYKPGYMTKVKRKTSKNKTSSKENLSNSVSLKKREM